MFTPLLFGMLVGFLLLDEMDNETLKALQVSPMPMATYVGYRLIIPMILSFLLTFLIYPLVNLVPLPALEILLMALVAAPAGPILGLFVANVAENKVQGFALIKALGGFLILPVIAFFFSVQWQLAFGIIPTYWPFKVYWLLEAGGEGVWLYVAGGLLYQAALITFLMRRFIRKVYR
jgi:fluoroquinolone transport system permease protein